MNKKEVLELKRRFKQDKVTFTRLCGCYVDANRDKVCKFGSKFLNLEDEEFHKYLEIANKCLSGKVANNLLNLEFPLIEEEVGGRQQILMALRDSNLENEELLDSFYDHVIDSYDYAGNYLILLFNDAYDVMTKTRDNIVNNGINKNNTFVSPQSNTPIPYICQDCGEHFSKKKGLFPAYICLHDTV